MGYRQCGSRAAGGATLRHQQRQQKYSHPPFPLPTKHTHAQNFFPERVWWRCRGRPSCRTRRWQPMAPMAPDAQPGSSAALHLICTGTRAGHRGIVSRAARKASSRRRRGIVVPRRAATAARSECHQSAPESPARPGVAGGDGVKASHPHPRCWLPCAVRRGASRRRRTVRGRRVAELHRRRRRRRHGGPPATAVRVLPVPVRVCRRRRRPGRGPRRLRRPLRRPSRPAGQALLLPAGGAGTELRLPRLPRRLGGRAARPRAPDGVLRALGARLRRLSGAVPAAPGAAPKQVRPGRNAAGRVTAAQTGVA